jgi:hypothetical protein
MQLIKSNDGLIGWKSNSKVIWCESIEELQKIGWAIIGSNALDTTEKLFTDEVSYAIDTMSSRNHSVAYFGVLGNFIYSEIE